MATHIEAFTVTIPAGTPQAAPVTVDVSFAPQLVEAVQWHQPHGAAGHMGWRITSGGVQVIPKTFGAFIITEGRSETWRLDGLHDSGRWEVTGYNTGTYNHVLHVRFHVKPIGGQDGPLGPLSWLVASRYPRSLVAAGGLAAAPEVVTVPRAVLWPPRGR